MADDALPPIKSPPIREEIDPLLETLSWSKAKLARFLGVYRPSVSRWAHGKSSAREPEKAGIRFLRAALKEWMDAGRPRREARFGEAALELGLRGLVCARFQVDEDRLGKHDFGEQNLGDSGPTDKPSPESFSENGDGETTGERPGRLLGPAAVRHVRERLGWIQAEMAAFFGVTHSTPAKWEGPDPGFSQAAEAGMIALLGWAEEVGESEDLRGLWQVGLSAFLSGEVGWETGRLPEK